MQAGYINMQILACCLHDTLVTSARASQTMISGRECHNRLLITIKVLIRQFRLLQDLLKGKLSEMKVLQQVPFRLLAPQHLEPLCELICLAIDKVRDFHWRNNITKSPVCWRHLDGLLCSGPDARMYNLFWTCMCCPPRLVPNVWYHIQARIEMLIYQLCHCSIKLL